MDCQIEEIEITTSLSRLQLTIPQGITFFPENFDSATSIGEFVFSDAISDLNKQVRKSNISVNTLGDAPPQTRSRKFADIILPTIVITLAQDPNVVSVFLNLLSNYIYDRLKGSLGQKTAQVELLIEHDKHGKFKKIVFKGGSKDFQHLSEIIKTINQE